MKKLLIFGACIGLMTAWSVDIGLAADKMNFSGRYLREAAEKTPSDSNTESMLEVVQQEDIVEIARVEKGQTMSSRCPLNGSAGDYTSRAGTSGKCKAQLKGNDLLLEWTATTLPPPEPMRGKERWQFSAESKRLTVKSHIYMPKGIHIEMTEKYTRSEKP